METIFNIPEGTYSFNLITMDSEGHRSLGMEKTVQIYGPKYTSYMYSLKGRKISYFAISGHTDAELTWSAADENLVKTVVKYESASGALLERDIPNDETQTTLPDIKRGSRYSIYSYFLPAANAIDSLLVINEGIIQGMFPRHKAGWTIIDVSDASTSGGGINRIIDGSYDNSQYWHSMYGPDAPLPHWAIIDMNERMSVAGVSTQRPDNGDAKTVQYFIADDPNGPWTMITEGAFASKSMPHTLQSDLAEPVLGQYLKLVLPDSFRPPYTSICEIDVYELVN
jgi:hypothetical protein